MILVFGGTSETAPLADMLASSGFHVLVSTATDIALDTGAHQRIRRRHGRLDVDELIALLHSEAIQAVVDAGHPYAEGLHDTARRACRSIGIPLIRFQRPASVVPNRPWLHWAAHHREAASMACRLGQRVLLTIGSQHIAAYVQPARSQGIALFARVLPEPESLAACLGAGLERTQVIAARGPFSVEDNRALLRTHRIQVLVTKESGAAGGLDAKHRAAEQENCQVVIIRRPVESDVSICNRFEAVIGKLNAVLKNTQAFHRQGT
jgi:precorrin-6A/cobalt-precorrin-6A reductase